MKVDVLVIGGGSAGLAAGIAAARCGAQTILVERQGMLGGMGTSALVHSFCGLYQLHHDGAPQLANPGIPTEIADRLLQTMGQQALVRMGRVDVLMHDPCVFATIADELAVASLKSLTVRFHSEVIDLKTLDQTLTEVRMACRGATECVHPKAVIDASGDAVSGPLAKAAFEVPSTEQTQSGAYVVSVQGVEAGWLTEAQRLRLLPVVVAGVRAGDLPSEALSASFRAIPDRAGMFVTIDLKPASYDPLAPSCLSLLETLGRDIAKRIVAYLKQHVTGLKNAEIAGFPGRAGIRESRQLLGQTQLTENDILSNRTFPDEVAKATWPIELRERATGPKLLFPAAAGSGCGIPLGTLRSRSIHNLWMAGRCISATHRAQASIRVMGTCLATGQAAGVAAALQAMGKSYRASDVRENLVS